MSQYRKKPVVIEAVQYVEYGRLVKGMCNSMSCFREHDKPHVHTIHGNQVVLLEVGDWIIPEPDGKHFYPVKPDIFEATYEPNTPTNELHLPTVARCREIALSVGENANEAAKAKDATDYIAGYQDCAVDVDEAIRSLSTKGAEG